MERIDCAVIGAGVVGLAIARAIAQTGKEVVVLEAENAIGTGTSARNSEVIHAGIYYPKGSLKAQFCVEGNKMLYDFCQSHGIPHKKLGKLIVATTEEQLPALRTLAKKAQDNGVVDLVELNQEQTLSLEPKLKCAASLLSPSSGIVDSHALMLALQGDLEEAGGMIALSSPVLKGKKEGNTIKLNVGGVEPMKIECDLVINSAGLSAQSVAKKLGVKAIPKRYIAKGNYFSLTGGHPFKRLIYPLPEPGGLGVHLTLDMGGQAKFGPDVEWIEEEYYTVEATRGESFYEAIRSYWPELRDNSLTPDYAGIRPKLSGPGEAAADFVIQGPEQNGLPGLINLYGIESPGLTSCLAIAKSITSLIK
ncbi:MAG: NAD(P)/FAD-dependent oxidoreductase [Alphaproteobacteria bacterium]|nr:NAD(P)/FAD-dependent oxidoreductase [Alphaproteobacteria bacterium]